LYKTRSMEDEILKIMAAEIAGENVTKEEREKMNRWWEEKRGNERTYKMLMGELGEVVRLVRQQGGLDREKAYERLESDIRKKMTVRKGKIRRMRWWSFGASVAGVDIGCRDNVMDEAGREWSLGGRKNGGTGNRASGVDAGRW